MVKGTFGDEIKYPSLVAIQDIIDTIEPKDKKKICSMIAAFNTQMSYYDILFKTLHFIPAHNKHKSPIATYNMVSSLSRYNKFLFDRLRSDKKIWDKSFSELENRINLKLCTHIRCFVNAKVENKIREAIKTYYETGKI